MPAIFLFVLLSPPALYSQCWNLVWSDEFSDTTVNTSDWTFEIGNGTGGWGNNELQYYTDHNYTLDSGHLNIIARDTMVGGFNYTSVRMKTQYKQDFVYGRIEARMKMPVGQGMWPAFWMMPTNSEYGGWPASGEIDIMEYLGHQTNRTHSTTHFGNSFFDRSSSGGTYVGGNFAASFHVFKAEWDTGVIRFYVDDSLHHTFDTTMIGAYNWPFDQTFYVILNLAVGGNWPGSPDTTTSFPQPFIIDYVRIYQPLRQVSISGEETIEPNEADLIYSVPAMTGVTYTWSVPAGATIVSGQGTRRVEVNWGTADGTISVQMNGSCDSAMSSKEITVSANLFSDNPGFEDDYVNWRTNQFNGATADFTITTTDVYAETKAASIQITGLSGAMNPWDVQLGRSNVNLEENEEYILSFYARADAATTISNAFINTSTFAVYHGKSHNLTTSWARYADTFTAGTTDSIANLNLDIGDELRTFRFDEFVFGKSAALALPVSFLGIDALCLGENTVQLNWQVADESETINYEIHRATDDSPFEVIDNVDVLNSGTFTNEYTYTDKQVKPNINYYYRIKANEINNKSLTTKVMSANCLSGLIDEIVVYPNPVKDLLLIENCNDCKQLFIYDLHGSLISTYVINSEQSIIELNIDDLPAGHYSLKVEMANGNASISKKILIE